MRGFCTSVHICHQVRVNNIFRDARLLLLSFILDRPPKPQTFLTSTSTACMSDIPSLIPPLDLELEHRSELRARNILHVPVIQLRNLVCPEPSIHMQASQGPLTIDVCRRTHTHVLHYTEPIICEVHCIRMMYAPPNYAHYYERRGQYQERGFRHNLFATVVGFDHDKSPKSQKKQRHDGA